MSYIDGLASGLNTTDIIRSLMQLEARPKVLLEQRVQATRAGLDAFASIRAKTSTVRTAAEALAAPSAWRALAATSSQPEAVAVSAGTGSSGGSVTFTVEQLAAAMVRSSGDTFSGAGAALDGRTLSITSGDHTFTSTATTLDALVAEINADDGLSVRASTIQVTPGNHRLVLTSTETGLEHAFSATGAGWDGDFDVTSQARDAVLDVGGITVTRSSNTIDDLIPQMTLTLQATTTSPVTVSAEPDVDGLVDKLKALVEGMNGALGEIKSRTGFDPETNRRSSLTGDATVRSLAQNLTNALVGVVEGNSLGSVGLLGIELRRDGTFALDESAFRAAFADDPAAVQAMFVPGATTSSPDITFNSAGWRAMTGVHDIELRNEGGVWSARIGGEEATVSVNDNGSLRLAISSTNERMGGMILTVSESLASGATGTWETIGTVENKPGVARRLVTATNRALDRVNGSLTSAEDSRKARIRDFDRQIDSWETRLELRELRLRQQYTALESLMGQLGNQSTWLSGQIAGLNA